MGSYNTKTDEEEEEEARKQESFKRQHNYHVRYNYLITSCREGCPEKRSLANIDPLYRLAFRNNNLLTSAALFYGVNEVDHILLSNRDIVNLIISIFLEVIVEERITKAPTLAIPWSIDYIAQCGYWDINYPMYSPLRFSRGRLMMIKHRGKKYRLCSDFWSDDIYYSISCHCPMHMESFIGINYAVNNNLPLDEAYLQAINELRRKQLAQEVPYWYQKRTT